MFQSRNNHNVYMGANHIIINMNGVYKGFVFTLLLIALVTLGAKDVPAAVGDDLKFRGTVQDVNGSRLNNSLINITIWEMSGTGPQLIGSNSTYSNESGGFNFTNVTGNVSWLYQVVVTYTNQTTGVVDYVGPSTPQFPYSAFVPPPLETNIDFYLRPAGTINITAINSTGDNISFWYQVKDIKLGYTIASNFGSSNYVQEKIIYVPRDRNYSIMVNANQSVPVSFEWNNFSATSDYDVDSLSKYNVTNHTLHKQFNCTDLPVQIYGYVNATGIDGWDDFAIVTYLLEPGSMVYLGAKFPYNMSFGPEIHNSSDSYNLTSGFYNITLPSSTEATNALLFAAAKNGSDYYGGFRNISLNSSQEINFTMYGLLGNETNITVQDAGNNSVDKNISTKKQAFNLVNATTNATLENVNAHMEIKVDYSNSSLYNCTEFTFMTDLNGENGTFYIPLINATGIKEINVYSMDYVPRRVGTRTADEIQANNNITMSAFIKDGGIDPNYPISKSNLKAFVYMSNSTCSIPYPQYISAGEDPCLIAGDVTMDMFNPLPAIIGGGKVDFSVKMPSTGIEVKYINVDFLASGPPDAKFDRAQTESTAGDLFSAALRFGSMGPTIYDYVLIGMPYTEGNTSQTGLDEAEVNMSIPLFYDENWNVIWNTDTDGINGTNLAGNHSHYETYYDEWETLMNGTTCTRTAITDASQINATHPCYIDTSRNLIWVRIPHFDGNSIRPAGGVITATPQNGGVTPGGGGGTAPEKMPSVSHRFDKIEPGAAVSMSINKTGLDFTQIQVEVKNRANDVRLTITKLATQPASVVHNVTGRVYQYVEIDRSDNINDTNIQTASIKFKVNNTWISGNNIDKNNVYLNRYANNQWNRLSTTMVSEDANYTYYSTVTPGFSVFVITGEAAAAQVCTPGAKQCVGDDLQECKSDGSAWETTETCQYGCDPTNFVCYSELQPVCTLDTKRCTGDNLEQCSSDGMQWTVSETCTYGCNSTTLTCKSAPEDYAWLLYLAVIVVIIVIIVGAVIAKKKL